MTQWYVDRNGLGFLYGWRRWFTHEAASARDLAAAPEEAAPPESDSDGASSPQSKPIPNQELVSRTDAEATLVDRARTLGDRDHQIA